MNLSYGHKFVPCPLQVCRRQTCVKTLERHSPPKTNPGFQRVALWRGGKERVGLRLALCELLAAFHANDSHRLMRETRIPLCELLASFHANDSHRCMRESRSARYETVDFERCIGFAAENILWKIQRNLRPPKFAYGKLA